MTESRYKMTIRIIDTLRRLRQRWWTAGELARVSGVSAKTARRDVRCCEDLGAPVIWDGEKYRIRADWRPW